jgi:hypothetical protein
MQLAGDQVSEDVLFDMRFVQPFSMEAIRESGSGAMDTRPNQLAAGDLQPCANCSAGSW